MTRAGRRRAILILVLGLVVAAAVAGAGLLLAADDGDQAAVDALPVPVPPFDPPTGPSAAVPADRISVSASSFLTAEGDITYEPINTIDDDPSTAWNSDVDGDGRGQVLVYRFREPIGLTAIRMVNGYAKDADVFEANHRIREVEVRTDTGVQLISLLDTSEEQEITFDFGTTSKVEMEVIDVYPGTGFDDPALSPDLALSEIGFVAVQR